MSRTLPLLLSLVPLAGCLPALEPVASTGPVVGQYGCDAFVPEIGDEPADLSIVYPPLTFCGDLDSTGNDGNRYTGDRDNTLFALNSSGAFAITLEWDSADADYDLYLFRSVGQGQYADVDHSSSGGYPEQISVSLERDLTYLAVVVGWSGPATGWGISVEPQ